MVTQKKMNVCLQETVSMVLLDYGLLCRKPKLCYRQKFGFVSSKPMFIAASVSIALQQFKPCFAKKRNTAFCEVSYLNQKPWLALRINKFKETNVFIGFQHVGIPLSEKILVPSWSSDMNLDSVTGGLLSDDSVVGAIVIIRSIHPSLVDHVIMSRFEPFISEAKPLATHKHTDMHVPTLIRTSDFSLWWQPTIRPWNMWNWSPRSTHPKTDSGKFHQHPRKDTLEIKKDTTNTALRAPSAFDLFQDILQIFIDISHSNSCSLGQDEQIKKTEEFTAISQVAAGPPCLEAQPSPPLQGRNITTTLW